jgi:hypothetical protein
MGDPSGQWCWRRAADGICPPLPLLTSHSLLRLRPFNQPQEIAMPQVSMTMGESPLPNALNAYYSYLVDLVGASDRKRVAINNVITPADIYDNTNFYDQYIFRTFADRLVLTSPTDYSLGNANQTSTYSYYWSQLLKRAIADIDIELSPDVQNKIDELDRQIDELRTKYSAIRTDLETRWKVYADQAGLDPKTDKFYIFKKKKFADDNGYATQLTGVRDGIALRLTKQNQFRMKAGGSQEDQILIQTYQYAVFDEYKETLPVIPDFEQQGGLTAADLTGIEVTGASGQFEADADIRPVGDLRNFFSNAKGQNHIGIDVHTTATHIHDSEWHVSASASYGFFSASVNADSESHIRTSLDKVRKITVSWSNMDDYFVRRGRWFNTDVLGFKRVTKILKADPRLTLQISRTVSSLVIARGLSIVLEFSDAASVERWEKSSFGGSGGASIFGISFGGGGSRYDYDYSLTKDSVTQTVTIQDDPRYARVCAFVTEEVIAGINQSAMTMEFADPGYYPPELVAELHGHLSEAS